MTAAGAKRPVLDATHDTNWAIDIQHILTAARASDCELLPDYSHPHHSSLNRIVDNTTIQHWKPSLIFQSLPRL
jgi:hypothetical protein